MLEQIKQYSYIVNAVVLLLVLAPSYGRAQTTREAMGWMQLYCGPPLRFDLNLGGLPNDATISLRAPWSEMLIDGAKTKQAVEMAGTWCTSECKPIKATIVFRKFNLDKKGEGSYRVEFTDGKKVEGPFRVVRTKQPKPFLCE